MLKICRLNLSQAWGVCIFSVRVCVCLLCWFYVRHSHPYSLEAWWSNRIVCFHVWCDLMTLDVHVPFRQRQYQATITWAPQRWRPFGRTSPREPKIPHVLCPSKWEHSWTQRSHRDLTVISPCSFNGRHTPTSPTSPGPSLVVLCACSRSSLHSKRSHLLSRNRLNRWLRVSDPDKTCCVSFLAIMLHYFAILCISICYFHLFSFYSLHFLPRPSPIDFGIEAWLVRLVQRPIASLSGWGVACLSGSSFSLGQGTGHLTDDLNDLDDLDDLDVERTAAEAPNEKKHKTEFPENHILDNYFGYIWSYSTYAFILKCFYCQANSPLNLQGCQSVQPGNLLAASSKVVAEPFGSIMLVNRRLWSCLVWPRSPKL